MVSEPLIVEAVATPIELPVIWSGAEQTKEFNVTGLTAESNKTVVAVVMVTSSPLAGTPSGFQLAASDQFPVPAPPSHTTGAGTVRCSSACSHNRRRIGAVRRVVFLPNIPCLLAGVGASAEARITLVLRKAWKN